MSQTDLALKMGYKDGSMITKIESGKVDISQKKVIAFAKALDTTPAYLMGWVSDEEYQQRWKEYQAEQNLLREPLTTDEKQLLSCYRVLPDPGKQYIHQQMRAAQLMYGEKSADISDSFMK